MNGRRFSLVLLLALAGCAAVAQGAVAQVGTQAVNTTAFTCVEGGGLKDFKDAHCDEFVGTEKGKFGHVAISKDQKTEIAVSQEGSSKFNGTLIGVNTEVICNKSASVAGKSVIDNVEVSGKHITTGTLQITLSECTVLKPSKCIVTDTVLTADFQGVEGLKPGSNDMGLELVGEGEEKTFGELIFHDKGAEKCAISNMTKPYKLKGSAIATGKVAQGNKQTGATWVLEDANEMETLEASAKKASLAGTFTLSMAGGGNPIALTTVT
jgi:hypothetical protein